MISREIFPFLFTSRHPFPSITPASHSPKEEVAARVVSEVSTRLLIKSRWLPADLVLNITFLLVRELDLINSPLI